MSTTSCRYDFSISEDETINLKDGVKNTLVTRLGLQLKLVDAETGLYMTGSGLGTATTTRELTLLSDQNLEETKVFKSICEQFKVYNLEFEFISKFVKTCILLISFKSLSNSSIKSTTT